MAVIDYFLVGSKHLGFGLSKMGVFKVDQGRGTKARNFWRLRLVNLLGSLAPDVSYFLCVSWRCHVEVNFSCPTDSSNLKPLAEVDRSTLESGVVDLPQ